ncbi:MAG: helix-turn-helix transcriptional regulator [Ruminococcaceae bacterium]|nr:helix-turn-helix transcriptional regulator [Oscillospiraceae bacterium]
MRELLCKLDLGEVRLTAVLFDQAFSLNGKYGSRWSMARLESAHQHSTYELFIVTGGEISIMTEQETLVCRNELVVIPPFINHYTVLEGAEGCCMYFSLEPPAKPSGSRYAVLQAALSRGIVTLPLNHDEQFYTSHLFECFREDIPKEINHHLLALLFYELFSRIAPQKAESRAVSKKYGTYINTVEAYISEHYNENITLSDLSEQLYLCTKQISRIIRRAYNCSLSELVNRKRLAVACMLLKYTNLPISEISANVGYGHENYFFTLFRRTYGRSPRAYRKEMTAAPEPSNKLDNPITNHTKPSN